ncbi:MAG: alanine--glyoxylate aminotransferase family protein [Mariprofundaceae bacterium]
MSRPTIGHLDPAFITMMNELKSLIQYAFQTKNELTLAISAPASAAMECCFTNLLETGDSVIICQNGVFGGRMQENVQRCGATAIMVQDEWGQACDAEKLETTLKNHPEAGFVAFVHAETSTGASSDAQILCDLAHQYNCLTIVDAVTSLAGSPLYVDQWGIDAVYAGSQKCLSCTPGLSPVSFSQAAVEVIKNRKSTVQSWFLDLNLLMNYWGEGVQGKRAYHHTAPVNALYALHESLLMLQAEGLEQAWSRHTQHHQALKVGLETLGLSFVVHEKDRLAQLNTVSIPYGIDDAKLRQLLLSDYSLEIGAGLGPMAGKVWRIGLMGYACRKDNVLKCIAALGEVLNRLGQPLDYQKALAASIKSYDQ